VLCSLVQPTFLFSQSSLSPITTIPFRDGSVNFFNFEAGVGMRHNHAFPSVEKCRFFLFFPGSLYSFFVCAIPSRESCIGGRSGNVKIFWGMTIGFFLQIGRSHNSLVARSLSPPFFSMDSVSLSPLHRIKQVRVRFSRRIIAA